MSFIQQQVRSFLNLGACKEYPIMARPKSLTSKNKTDRKEQLTTGNMPPVTAAEAVASVANKAGTQQMEATRPETGRLAVVRTVARTSVVPMNLDEEIRRRAYELSEHRGFLSGHETEDWLVAEREVLQQYSSQNRQHSA